MIKFKYKFEKEKLNNKNKKHFMMLEIKGCKKDKKQQNKRKKLNIAFALDISGSMGNHISSNLKHIGLGLRQELSFNQSAKSKLDLVKEATLNAIDNMKDGDLVSLVTFDSQVDVMSTPIELNESSRKEIKTIINNIRVRGMTNLHGGWLEACEQVAKNLDSKYLNRVIVLTDGQTNMGETNNDVIVSDVLALSKKGISTTTFGVGEDFNETLLEAMSNSGSGNFYFIEKSEDFLNTFSEEFEGMSNIVGFEPKISFVLNDGFKVTANLNGYVFENGAYSIPDIRSEKNLKVLFKIKSKDFKIAGQHDIGYATLTYKDDKGKEVVRSEVLIAHAVENKEWKKLEVNEDVESEKIIINVAKEKEKAMEAIRSGNLELGKSILRGSNEYIQVSGLKNPMLMAETKALNSSIDSIGEKSNANMLKDLHYQAYRSKTSRN